MAWSGYAGDQVLISHSQSESQRFDRSIGRVVVGLDADPQAVASELERVVSESSESLLVVRYPTAMASLGAAVAASGRSVIAADVLTYWEVPAQHLAALGAQAPGLTAISAAEDDTPIAQTLATVIEDSFRGYGNHYSANPDLDPELALAGYLEWAIAAAEQDRRNVVVLRQGEDPVGVATLTQDGDDLEVELAGLVGRAQGQGWYPVLLTAVGAEAVRRGLPRVIISTQVSNVRVQRAWAKAGFRPFSAITTLHATRH